MQEIVLLLQDKVTPTTNSNGQLHFLTVLNNCLVNQQQITSNLLSLNCYIKKFNNHTIEPPITLTLKTTAFLGNLNFFTSKVGT